MVILMKKLIKFHIEFLLPGMSKLKELSENNKKLSDNNVFESAKIKIIGIGGAGCAVINRLMQTKIKGVELIAINTDGQALVITSAHRKLKLAKRLTRGLGAGGNRRSD